MRRYSGLLEPARRVTIEIDKGAPQDFVHPAIAATMSWGNKLALPGARLLAFALLFDVLENEIETRQYRDRFMWRKVVPWSASQPWTITDAEILAVIATIKQVEVESGPMKAALAQAPTPVVHEGGIGVSGAPIKWGKDE